MTWTRLLSRRDLALILHKIIRTEVISTWSSKMSVFLRCSVAVGSSALTPKKLRLFQGGELRLGIFFPDDIKVGIGAVRAVIDQMKECELKSGVHYPLLFFLGAWTQPPLPRR